MLVCVKVSSFRYLNLLETKFFLSDGMAIGFKLT